MRPSMQLLNQLLRERARVLHEHYHISILQMAKESGVGRNTITHWLRHDNRHMHFETILALERWVYEQYAHLDTRSVVPRHPIEQRCPCCGIEQAH